MRYSSIDIGSNSVLFTCIEYEDGNMQVVKDVSVITGLSWGMEETFKPSAIERTVHAVCNLKEESKRIGCGVPVVIGTMALRRAKNREVFLKRLKKACGLDVRILSGEEEGYYSFISVSLGVKERIIVCDIGGGSTEIVSGVGRNIDYIRSVPMGAVTLYERFIDSDPPSRDEVNKMLMFIESSLDEIQRPYGERVVGIGGTVTTLAAIHTGKEYSREAIEGVYLERDTVEKMIEMFMAKNSRERRRIKGMEKGREDIILAGTGILYTILNWAGFDGVYVSTGGVRYGVLMEKIEGGAYDTHIQKDKAT